MGRDKRTLILDGSLLLQRQADLLREVTGLNATLVGEIPDSQIPSGLRRIDDAIPDCGPLGGIVAALQDCATTWALILAVDMPGIKVRELDLLISSCGTTTKVITLSQDGTPEPLAALYPSASVDFWQKQLESGLLKIRLGLEEWGFQTVRLARDEQSLFNINSPEDWDAFLRNRKTDEV